TEISFRLDCQHGKIILVEEPHDKGNFAKRNNQLTQFTKIQVSARAARATNQRGEFSSSDVKVFRNAFFREKLLHRQAIGAHDQGAKAAVGFFDDGLKSFFEHRFGLPGMLDKIYLKQVRWSMLALRPPVITSQPFGRVR